MGKRQGALEELVMGETSRRPDATFWKGKRVLITGHTGFKGGWASLWLSRLGAEVTGLSLAPDTEPNLFELCHVDSLLHSRFGDLRDADIASRIVDDAKPEIVLHLAAQSLVRRAYASPLETFATNVMGTANLLNAARRMAKPEAVLVVTTDKVYANAEDGRLFAEEDPLGGHDPYSASKACAEIVTQSYARSFFAGAATRVATARGGNVIGGGDFSEDRLVPDVWRAWQTGRTVVLRYPDAIRPWQHVLDCLCGYFVFLEDLAQGRCNVAALNFAPSSNESPRVSELVECLQRGLGIANGWSSDTTEAPREMQVLRLSGARAMKLLGWRSLLDSEETISWTTSWYKDYSKGLDMRAATLSQIASFTARP